MHPAPATLSTNAPQSPKSDGRDSTMIVTLRLSGEVFGIPVTWVHEIIDPIPATTVPNAPPYAPALINVRGAVVPLFDMRHRLDMAAQAFGANARIIVIETQLGDVPLHLAIMADAVDEVIDISSATIDPVPILGAPWPADFIYGALRHGGNLVILLNPETVFRPNSPHAKQDILQ